MIRFPSSTSTGASAAPPSKGAKGKKTTAKAKAKQPQVKTLNLPESVVINLLLHIHDRSNLLSLSVLNRAWFAALHTESIDTKGWKRLIQRDAPFAQAVLSPWLERYWGPTLFKRGMSCREMYFACTTVNLARGVQIVPLANWREPFQDLHPIAYGQDLPAVSCPPGTQAVAINRDQIYLTDRNGQVTGLDLTSALDGFDEARIEHYRRRPLPYGFIRMSPDASTQLTDQRTAVAAHSRPAVTSMPDAAGRPIGSGPAPYVVYVRRDTKALIRIRGPHDGGFNMGPMMGIPLWAKGDTFPNEKWAVDLDGMLSITCPQPDRAVVELRPTPRPPSSSTKPLSSADDYFERLCQPVPLTRTTQLVALTVTPCGWAFAASRDRLWAQRCCAAETTNAWLPVPVMLPEGHVFASRPVFLANNGTTAFIASRLAEDGDADDTYNSNYWSMLVVQLTPGNKWDKPFRGIAEPIRPREIEGVRDFGIVDGQLVVVSFEGELVMSPTKKIERLEKRLPLQMVVASQFSSEMAVLVVMPRDLSAFFPYGSP